MRVGHRSLHSVIDGGWSIKPLADGRWWAQLRFKNPLPGPDDSGDAIVAFEGTGPTKIEAALVALDAFSWALEEELPWFLADVVVP